VNSPFGRDVDERFKNFDKRFEQSRRRQARFGSAIVGAIVGVAAYFAAQEHAITWIGGPWSAGLGGAAVGVVLSFIASIFRR